MDDEKVRGQAGDPSAPALALDWKFWLGVILLSLSCLIPFSALLLPFLHLHPAVSAAIGAVCVFGLPEILSLAAIPLLGRQTFDYLMSRLWHVLKKLSPPARVSRLRYYAGLTVFVVSCLPQYTNSYLPQLLPADQALRVQILALSDLAWVGSFFILGGDFWEKFRRLFIYDS